jgi:hypothetical protein
MRKKIVNILEQLFPEMVLNYRAYNLLIKDKKSYLHKTGWLKSVQCKKPLNSYDLPIPWMNYPVIAFLEERLEGDLEMFEFGSGYSTLYFAERVKSICSVEYDEQWFNLFKTKELSENVNILFCDQDVNDFYCKSIKDCEKLFDIVLVDGRDRVNCIKESLDVLTERGVVLLDDSHRLKYSEGFEFLLEQGFRSLNFEGLKPSGSGVHRTTIFYKDRNCLGI